MEIPYEKSWEDIIVSYIKNNKYRIKKGPIHDGAASQSVSVDGRPSGKIYFHKREPAAGFLTSWSNYSEDWFEDKEVEFYGDGTHSVVFSTMEDDVGEVALGAIELYNTTPTKERLLRIEASELSPDAFSGTAKLHPLTRRTVINLNATETKRIGSSVTFTIQDIAKGKYILRVYYYSRRRKGMYEIFYLFNGSGKYIVEGTEYELLPGCMILLRPNETRQLVLTKDAANDYITIEFQSEFIRVIDPKLWLLEAFNNRSSGVMNLYMDKEIPRELSRVLKGIAESSENDPYKARISLAIKLQMILCLINETYRNMEQLGTEPESEDLARKVMRYINSYLTEDISTASIAKAFYTSKSNLDYIFHKTNGYSIYSYILLKRLLLAQELLQKGISASEVSFQCGFKEYSTFYRQYKKHFGISPQISKRKE